MTDSLIVTLHIRSFARFDEGGSRAVELLDAVSGDKGESVEVLSKLDLLNCRKCDVHCAARRGAEGERVAFRDISPLLSSIKNTKTHHLEKRRIVK